MYAKELLNYLGYSNCRNHYISGITDNYLEVKNNYIYIGKGEYYYEAFNRGAKTIIIEDDIRSDDINLYYTYDYRNTLSKALYYFNKNKLNKISFIGVTGTNAKTTISYSIYQYLCYIGKKSMYIGSNGVIYGNNKIRTNNTTPGIVELYKYINLAYKNNIRYISMEISSVSVHQRRVFLIPFKILILSNIEEDHLDYHKNIYEYRFNKYLPFYLMNKGIEIINSDSNYYKEAIRHSRVNYYTYSLNSKSDYRGVISFSDIDGSTFSVNDNVFRTKLIGRYNVLNLIPTIVIADKLFHGYRINRFIEIINPIPGRMNIYRFKDKNIIIDYAHTESAVEGTLAELSRIINSRMFIVCGCGGNREKEKREKIGLILAKYDNVLLTNDNPRNENPLDIINDINKCIKPLPYILDRKQAIISCLDKMNSNEYLVILGKGNEDYMEINNLKYPYSDLEVINEYFS